MEPQRNYNDQIYAAFHTVKKEGTKDLIEFCSFIWLALFFSKEFSTKFETK